MGEISEVKCQCKAYQVCVQCKDEKPSMHVGAQPRLGIVINLDDLESLLREFIRDSKPDLSQQLLLSTFLLWVNNKMKEQLNGTQSNRVSQP